MRVLVVGPDRESFASFAGVLAELARRGHERRLVVAQQRRAGNLDGWGPLDDPVAPASEARADAAQVSWRRLLNQVRADLVLVLEGRHQPGLAKLFRLARARNLPVVVRFPSAESGYEEAPGPHEADWALVSTEFDRTDVAEKLRLPPYRVVSTGALEYDHWFDQGPISDRNALCGQLGLTLGPYLICRLHSVGRAREQRDAALRWIRALTSDVDHPFRAHQILIADTRLTIEVWNPLKGGLDNTRILETKRGVLRDAIAHSAAVVSTDPRGLIEAVILRRPALVLTERGGTIGPVPLSSYLDPAEADRTEPVKAPEFASSILEDGERRRFLELAIRPYGLSLPASHAAAQALEKMAVIGPCRPFVSDTVVSIVRPLLTRIAAAAARRDAARRPAESVAPPLAAEERVRQSASKTLAPFEKEARRTQKEAARAAKEAHRVQKECALVQKRKAREQRETAKEAAQVKKRAASAEKEKVHDTGWLLKKSLSRRWRVFLNAVSRGPNG